MGAVVVGLGKTGVSCLRHLTKQGVAVSATDSRSVPPGLAALGPLAKTLDVRLGGFDMSLLDGATQLVMSPGVSLNEPIAREARARGIDIVGDVELFARAARAPVIGVTGTNGKSTVTMLTAAMGRAAGRRVLAGGNLGEPVLELLGQAVPDLYVIELSSFQLETTSSLDLLAAAVLNITADHLDRYASLGDYARAKARIVARAATLVLNADDPLVAGMGSEAKRTLTFSTEHGNADYSLLRNGERTQLVRFGEIVFDTGRMKIKGRHNAANALAALALGDAAGLPLPAMLDALEAFPGLPHRSAWVADRGGVRFIDDSKGTNVGATAAAIAGLQGPLVVILGGEGKGQDFGPLAAAFGQKVTHAVLIGKDAPLLEQALAGACSTERAASMEEAVRAAARSAKTGDTVLLSPACASLDMFRDYGHRGDVFAAAVRALSSTGGGP